MSTLQKQAADLNRRAALQRAREQDMKDILHSGIPQDEAAALNARAALEEERRRHKEQLLNTGLPKIPSGLHKAFRKVR